MARTFKDIISGYHTFREKYATGDNSVMEQLADRGQKPKVMVIACSDSRVDPALILQCHPGELFVVRNVANIVPPFEKDDANHGTSAALEFGIKYLKVKDLIILGHSQCGGINGLINNKELGENDFITRWISNIKISKNELMQDIDSQAKAALLQSYNNSMSFPWIKEEVNNHNLSIHLWFFNIKDGIVQAFNYKKSKFESI